MWTALACAALLVVPVLGLLVLPLPGGSGPGAPAAARSAATAAPAVETEDEPAAVHVGVVHGVVRDEASAPVAGARVRVASGRGMPAATSDADGSYRLRGVPDDAASLLASADGFAEARVSLPKPSADGAERVVDIQLARAAPITGVVVDPDDKPVARAFVSCEGSDLGAPTDDEGRFQLPPEAAGCAATATHLTFGPSDRVTLRAGRDNTLHLGRGGGLSGVVVDERGAPVASYLLAIESFVAAGGEPEAGQAGKARKIESPTGEFTWEGLAAGRYVLTASADGRPPARSDSLTVDAGRTTSHVRIVLAKGATLVGTVTDAATRAPIEGATVGLDAQTQTGANAIAPVTTDASGAFTLVGVPPGPFSIRVAHPEHRTKIVPGLVTRGAPQIREDVELKVRGDGGAESELAGIGAVLAPTPKGTLVAGVIEGGPAALAGVRRFDVIERIDGVSTESMTVSDCVQRLRGPEGSRVSVTVARAGEPSVEITITRDVVVR